MRKLNNFILLLSFLMSLFFSTAHAGIFDLPAFLEPGKLALGLEPEIILSDGSGVGFNGKVKYGSSNFLNWQAFSGMGTGDRKFRVGVTADFEFFPDVEGQPGIALPLTLKYTSVENDLESFSLFTLSASPLAYKTFKTELADYTGFLALPIGWNIKNSHIYSFVSVVVGSLFKLPITPRFKYSAEIGISIRDTYSYVSGGATYFF